jgi:tRNA (guanine37-N1)-methyltransferase
MLCLKVPLRDAEKVKRELMAKGLLDDGFSNSKDKEFIFFPVKKRFDSDFSFMEKELKERAGRKNLKDSLGEKLTKEELEAVGRSMDVVGSIAILEIPEELKSREKMIAGEVLRLNKNIKTVLRKGRHEGAFRTQKLEHLAGENTKETIYKENNVSLKLDVEKVYFSPRLSNERKRIMKLVKKDEAVLVMFSGCAPYVCVIAKNSPAKSILGIEINPEGHRYGLENLKLNKIKNANLINDDVKNAVKNLHERFDRILMPLPKSAGDFLDSALSVSKKGTIIHFYDFQKTDETAISVEKIRKACEKAGLNFEVLDIVKCGQQSPRTFRICVDLEIV